MKQIQGTSEMIGTNSGFAVDTTFVLFFLAIEFGRSTSDFGLDGVLLAVTLLMLIVFPYFLAADGERPEFGKWLIGRSLIAAFAASIGVIFNQTLGVILPDTLRFLPMTLLIVTSMISCYIQFYGFLKFRPAK